MLNEYHDNTLDYILIEILITGFKNVYKKVLSNAFEDINTRPEDMNKEQVIKISEKLFGKNIFADDPDILNRDIDSLHTLIIEYSIRNDKVFDLEKREFSDDIINSTRTDIEVMKVIVDLMGILITGNQMILTGKHMF